MDRRFQFYLHPAQTVNSTQTMTVDDVYEYITLDMRASQATRELRKIEDEKERKKFKSKNFDFVCFSGTFSYRMDNCLIEHSGLICLDFDHLPHLEMWDIRKKLIADPFFNTQLLFTSPSGDGLKWVVDIDLNECDHRTWFRAISNYVRETYRLEADPKCANVSRACFLPNDGNCYVNPEYFNKPGVCPF